MSDYPPPEKTDGHERTLADWLVVLKVKVDRVLTAWYDSPGEEQARIELQKVIDIATAALKTPNVDERTSNTT